MKLLVVLFVSVVGHVVAQRSGFLMGSQGFMFNSMFGRTCTPIHNTCPLQCSEYEKDGHGCDVCHCKGDGTSGILKGPDHGTDYHVIHSPCIPTQRNCPVKCESFVKGGGGTCEFCMCENVHHESSTKAPITTNVPPTTTNNAPTITAMPTSQAPTTLGSTVSQDCKIAKQICSSKCNAQYLVDPSDCTFCVCKSDIPSGK